MKARRLFKSINEPARAGIMLMLLLIATSGSAISNSLSSSKGKAGTQTDKMPDAGILSSSTLFSESFEGAFPADNWLVQDINSNNGLDYWDDTSYRSQTGSWSGWCAQIGTQTTTILNENFEGAFPGSWTVEDFDSASGNDIWDDTSYRTYGGSRSAWCAEIGTKAMPPATVFYEGFEGAWPGSWIVYDSNEANGYDYWGDYSGKSYVGSWSGYCADEGAHPVGCGYDDNMDAYMYRNVSLSGYSSVTLSYYYWLSCESGYDNLYVTYFDGSWHDIDQHTGNISAWQYSSVSIPTSAVYVGLHFHSDVSICYFAGAFVDQIQLTGIPQVPNNSVHEYDNDMEAYMYHSVSLSGYSSVTLSYYYWLSCESGYDNSYVTYFDGSWHDIDRRTGSSGGWQSSSVSIPTSATYVGFHFSSDGSICNFEGAYVDQVILTADIPNTSLHTYDDYMDTRMVRKYTIDASTWATATLHYWAWYQTESSYDYCQVIVTRDAGAHWYPIGEQLTGSSGWSYHTLPVPDTYLTSLFNVGFVFHSDGSIHNFEGVYLDNITMEYDSTIYIRADGSVDPPSAPILREGNFYALTDSIYTSALEGIVIQRSNVILDGAGFTLQGPGHASELVSYGITIQGISNVTIRNMKISEFDLGVYVFDSPNNVIEANSATDCDVGISLFGSSSNRVIENSLTRNINYTISLHSASDNIIQENNMTDNDGYGIGISTYSHRNNITGNTIAATDWYGIISYTSFNTTLTGNNIRDNYGGISLTSSKIFAYHNNFINNSIQADIYASPSFWDDGYPSGGNYWSDYAGSDFFSGPYQDLTGSDGIGDTRYTIDESNRDLYPLMEPWELGHISTRYDWPMFRCNVERNGYTRSPGPSNNQKLWNYTTGGVVFSSPTIVGRRVYVGSRDFNVYCLDALTGERIWFYPTSGWVHSSPAVANNRVYVGSYDRNVYCLFASTGELSWNYTTGGRVSSSPVVVNGKVYVGSWDNKTYCLNAETGEYIWSYTTMGPLAPSPPAVAYGKVYVGSSDGRIYCLNAETGAHLWSQTTGAGVYACPAIADGRVYVGSGDSKVYCLSAQTGEKIWNYPTGGGVSSSCAVADGRVYVGSDDGKVYCLSAETGEKVWHYTTGGNITYSSPALSYGRVYIGSDDNRTYCLDSLTGAQVWNYTAEWHVRSSPAVADNVVYVGSNDGNVYALGSVIKVPDDYPTIQAAIDAANPGDTIVIAPGIYNESVVVNKRLTIIGQRGSSTTFSGGGYGVAITISGPAASGTIIAAVTIIRYGQGILIADSASCRIYDNIMYLMGDSGVVLKGSAAGSNIIYGNSIYGNNVGINLTQTSPGNIIYCNTISQNAIGIKLSDSSGNIIYMNSFIGNAIQAMSNPSINAWDNGYPTGGNYWSNYAGVDIKHGSGQDLDGPDGIGDTPYDVSVDNVDNYPRMKPHDWIRPLGDVNYDGNVNSADLHDLSLAYGSVLGMPKWNQNCDFAKDNKIEVMDLYHLGKNYGLTYP